MISPQTKLKTSLLKLQKKQAQFYFLISERFKGNSLVSEKWRAAGAGLEKQAEILRALPPSFWKTLDRKQARALSKTVAGALEGKEARVSVQDPLRPCLATCLDLEEPLILEIYAPLMRAFKAHWTDRVLEWYVMVRSHLTRLTQLIEPFCGDPALARHCALLVERFETALQRPRGEEGEVRVFRKAASKARKEVKHKAGAGEPRARRVSRVVACRETMRPVQRRIPKSAKPLIGKVRLRRSPA